MRLTRITEENQDYFHLFLPPGPITPEQEGLGILTDDGDPRGVALLSGTDGDAALDWFFVHPGYRRQGIGSEFLEKIEDVLRDGMTSCSVSYPAETEGVDEFLIGNGYFVTEGDCLYSVPLASIRKQPEAVRLRKSAANEDVRTLSSLNQKEREAFFAFLDNEFGGQAKSFRCDPELSFAAFDENRLVSAAVVMIQEPESKDLFITALASKDPTGSWIVLGEALSILEQEPEFRNSQIRFIAGSIEMDSIAQKIKERIQETLVQQIRFAVKAL